MDSAPCSSKRSRDGSDNVTEETNKCIRPDLLFGVFYDDIDGERDAAAEDIANVIKSLEDEIGLSPSSSPLPVAGDELPTTDLGYLLKASDDELGLPPTRTGKLVDNALILDWETEDCGFGQFEVFTIFVLVT